MEPLLAIDWSHKSFHQAKLDRLGTSLKILSLLFRRLHAHKEVLRGGGGRGVVGCDGNKCG